MVYYNNWGRSSKVYVEAIMCDTASYYTRYTPFIHLYTPVIHHIYT